MSTMRKQKTSTYKKIKQQAKKMEDSEMKKISRAIDDYRIATGAMVSHSVYRVTSQSVEIGSLNATTTAKIC